MINFEILLCGKLKLGKLIFIWVIKFIWGYSSGWTPRGVFLSKTQETRSKTRKSSCRKPQEPYSPWHSLSLGVGTPVLAGGHPFPGQRRTCDRTWVPPGRTCDRTGVPPWNGPGTRGWEGTWDQRLGHTPPHFLTETCENRIFRRTTYAGGKNCILLHVC